jgi:hypothetical protein
MNEAQFIKRFDFDTYSVVLTDCSITYVFSDELGVGSYQLPSYFTITIDEEKQGGKIQINFKDQWGSEMQFIHYFPSDLKGMFDFIGRGYGISKFLNK